MQGICYSQITITQAKPAVTGVVLPQSNVNSYSQNTRQAWIEKRS